MSLPKPTFKITSWMEQQPEDRQAQEDLVKQTGLAALALNPGDYLYDKKGRIVGVVGQITVNHNVKTLLDYNGMEYKVPGMMEIQVPIQTICDSRILTHKEIKPVSEDLEEGLDLSIELNL